MESIVFVLRFREIFETAGYTVNMNISPSLRRFNERYYLSGKYISDDQALRSTS